MLPSYMNASYMGAAPLYMNIYQHIQHLRGYPLNLTTHPPASSACVAANLIPQSSMSSPGSVGASLFPKQLPSVKSSNDANCDPAGSDAKEGSSQRSSGSRPASDTSAMKFSIDSILGLRRDNHSPSRGGEGQSQELTKTPGGAGDDDDEEESDDRKDAGSGGGDVGGKGDEDAPDSYPWLQCTRYHPPKLQRSKKKDGGGKKRKLGRNPRVPFTQHQVAVLEEKFRRTHYLSSMDVAELSAALTLSETRVKIWFQNRRARERREREATQRAQMLTQKPYQPLSIPSVTWALTSQLAPSVFTGQYRGDMNMNFRAGLFSSAFSAFSAPVARQDVTSESRSAARSWVEPHNSEDESFY